MGSNNSAYIKTAFILGGLAYFTTACSPVNLGSVGSAAKVDGAQEQLGDDPIPMPSPAPQPAPGGQTPTPDIESPMPGDVANAKARCEQLAASRPAQMGTTVYQDLTGGVIEETFSGQSVGKIIAAIAKVKAYFNTIGEAHTGAANVLLSAHTIGDVSAGFGTVYIVGGGSGSTVHDVVAGAPAKVVICGMTVNSVSMGVGKLVLVDSQVGKLIGASITVVKVNSTILSKTVGLLKVIE